MTNSTTLSDTKTTDKLLLTEEEQVERQINRFRLVISLLFFIIFAYFYFSSSTHYTASYFIVAAFTIWLLYSGWFLRITNKHLYRPIYKYLNVTIDMSVLSIVFLAALFLSSGSPDMPVMAIMFIFIAITALRQNSWACLYTGIIAAIAFAVIYFVSVARDENSMELSKAIIVIVSLLTTAAISARVAYRQRQLLLQFVNSEQKRIVKEQELQLARNIQMGLLPQTPPSRDDLEIAWVCQPAFETSGDFYDYVSLSDNKIGIVVADVTGKGLSAAMIAVGARSTMRAETKHHHSPALTLEEVNRRLVQDIPSGAFIAKLYAILDIDLVEVIFVNAGQMVPILRRGDDCRFLEPESGFPLGIVPDINYVDYTQSLQSGDMLLFYTDGIVEAMNENNKIYGFERLEKTVVTAPSENPQVMIDYLLDDVKIFVGQREAHDDITIVAVSIL